MIHQVQNLPFQIQDVPATKYAFVRKWVKWSEVPQFFNDNMLLIAESMTSQGAPPQYPPSMFIHKWDDTKQESELSVAIQTTVPVTIAGGGTIQFPEGKALIAIHKGAVEETGAIHDMLSNYIEKNNLMLGIAIEEYRSVNTDPNTLETGIIYRLYDGVEVPRIIA